MVPQRSPSIQKAHRRTCFDHLEKAKKFPVIGQYLALLDSGCTEAWALTLKIRFRVSSNSEHTTKS